LVEFQDSHPAAAQNEKIKLQIKPKAGSGGFQLGWFKLKYQASKLVSKAPPVANPKLSRQAMIKDCQRWRNFMTLCS
jgi:hypothetical protein